MVLSGRQRATLVQPEGFRSSPTCSKESGSIPRPGTVGQLSLNIMCATPPNDVILQRQVITTYLTSIGPSIIPPPGQSQPPPHDQGSSSIERSWERRERCPGLSSRKKGEHRSEVDRAVVSSSNNKSLHDVEYCECSIASILPWSWVGGNTHGLRGYPEAVEALRQENCHWRTLVFGTCFSKEILGMFTYNIRINHSNSAAHRVT